MRALAVAGSFAVSALACSSTSSGPAGPISSSSPLCAGAGRCVAIGPSATETQISAVFAQVKDGDTLAFSAGVYSFRNQLALGPANGVTVIGAGRGQTILDFMVSGGAKTLSSHSRSKV